MSRPLVTSAHRVPAAPRSGASRACMRCSAEPELHRDSSIRYVRGIARARRGRSRAQSRWQRAHDPDDDLHTLPGRSSRDIEISLRPGELITAVALPASRLAHARATSRCAIARRLRSRSLPRRSRSTSTAARSNARVALGGVATKPWREHGSEEALVGKPLALDAFDAPRRRDRRRHAARRQRVQGDLARREIARALDACRRCVVRAGTSEHRSIASTRTQGHGHRDVRGRYAGHARRACRDRDERDRRGLARRSTSTRHAAHLACSRCISHCNAPSSKSIAPVRAEERVLQLLQDDGSTTRISRSRSSWQIRWSTRKARRRW